MWGAAVLHRAWLVRQMRGRRYGAHMGAERMTADELAAVTWTRAWRQGPVTVRLGETGDGRWVAWHSRRGGYAYWTERGACDRAERMLSRGLWSAVEPAQETTAA